MKIPTVSLENHAGASQSSPIDVGQQIYQALRTAGAFYVVDHGIQRETTDRCFAAAKSFHSLPAPEKLKLQARHFGGARGYIPSDALSDDPDTGSYDLAPQATSNKAPRARRYEAFDIGREVKSRDESKLASMVLNENPWPNLVGFRDSITSYFDLMVGLGRRILLSLCGELKVDQGYFASRTKDPCCTLRLMHYPDDLERRTEGIHPHTDFECLSILTGSTGGLQVLSRKGVWLDVETPEESFLVIAGDLLEVLSNGELESTLHRVVMSEAERYSLSFFFGFDYDVVVEPLSSLGTMDTSTYSAIHSGEHLVAMNVRTFRHLRRRVVQNEITLPMQVPSENPFIARKLQRVRTDKS